MLKKLTFIALLATFPSVANARGQEPVPPVGQRSYIVNAQEKYAPVTISGSKSSKGSGTGDVVLRDPIGLNDPDPTPTQTKPARILAKPKRSNASETPDLSRLPRTLPKTLKSANKIASTMVVHAKHPPRLSFKTMAVGGQVREPRVNFAQERLAIEPDEEPISIMTLQKIMEDVRNNDAAF